MKARPGSAARRWFLLASLAAARAGPAAAAPADLPGPDRDLLQFFGLRSSEPPPPEPGELMYFVLPAFGSNPTVGVALGVTAQAAVALGPLEDTTVSSASASVMVTTREQLMSSLKSVFLTRGNDWELLGDARYYRFSQDTFGLGTGAEPIDGTFILNGMETAIPEGAQPMRFDYVKVHETALRRVSGDLYAGLGYHLDVHWNVRADVPEGELSSNEAYSLVQGFDPTRYALSGVSLNALYESRDHTIDPYHGTYALLSFRANPTWLGSSRTSTMLHAEARHYFPLSILRERHVLAVWAYAQAVTSGEAPYLDLPAIGYDTRDRSGRGYPQGRFRGTSLAYGEVEYRFPISGRGLVAGVLFANVTTAARPPVRIPEAGVDDPGIALFDSLEPSAGAGLRLRADARARMSLVVDYAFGRGGFQGFYLSMGETF